VQLDLQASFSEHLFAGGDVGLPEKASPGEKAVKLDESGRR
jgi:hypothetical protein